MKRMFCVVAVLFALVMPVYGNEVYEDPLEGTVTRSKVNVRAKPSTKAGVVINLVAAGNPVTIHEMVENEDRYWYKVEIFMVGDKLLKQSLFGWIAAEFVDVAAKSEVTYVKLPKEMWGLTIGTRKSAITGLEEVKDENGGSSYLVRKQIKLGAKLEVNSVYCDFDEKDNLERVEVRTSHSEKKMNDIYSYVVETYGETKDFGDEEGADGVYLTWTDKDTGYTLELSYYPYKDFDYMSRLSFGVKYE